MKFYLSSFKLGNEPEKLKQLISENKRIGFIPNALDCFEVDLKRLESEVSALRELGLEVEFLNLKDYFGKEEKLKNKINELGAVWVCGGNVFVLRQGMKLSGLDKILQEMKRDDFVYGGYSAGGCVLSQNLDPYKIVDDQNLFPYDEQNEVIWEGFGLIDYAFLPHYNSDHPESDGVDKTVEYCKENTIPFKTLQDGEVIIIE